jgi:chitinase
MEPTAKESEVIPQPLVAETESIDRKIVAYFVEWGDQASHQNYTVDKIPWDKVTHINYAFAKVDGTTHKIAFCNQKAAIEKEYPGQLANLPYKGHFNLLTKYKQQYPKVKTLISVGGWTDTRGFYEMTDTAAGRETFANSCVDFIKTYGFDGVDIDYEYPTATVGAGNPDDFDVSQTRRAKLYKNYDALMQVLRVKLDEASQADGRKYLLTAALPASSWILGGMDTSEAVKYLDFANLMTYDFHGAWNGFVGHNSALYPDSRDPETLGFAMPVLNIDWAKRYFRGALPSEKINIGVPYYTRGWKNVTQGSLPGGLYGSAAKTGGGATGEDNYWGDVDPHGKEISGGSNPLWHVKNLLKRPEYKRYYDDVSKVPYV